MKKSINYFGRVLCALLLCAGMVMTSCEEMNPVDDNKTEQGGNENNGNEGGDENSGNGNEGGENTGGEEDKCPATLTLDKVTATTATFTGHLNVAASDLPFSQVTVYYSDAETFNMNAAESVSATSFDKDQNFTIILENLKYNTKYNYCMVAEVKSKKTYGDVLDFTTENVPFELSVDKVTATTATFTGHLNVAASDLSFSQVTVYYSDAETFNMNSAESVSATSFDKDQNFTIILKNLKYNTKYNYCMVAEVKSEKIYGDVLDFTTENVTFSELSVVPSRFKAEVGGSVTGLSDEDKEYIKVGILYSSESGKVENGEGEKIEATEISADGVFSVLLPDLTLDTKYYYCGYVYQGGSYTYGTPTDFTTLKHQYDNQHDLNVSAATNLSSSGSANCYIISASGLYKFKTVKGNSNESVGNVASASILWETFGTHTAPELLDLIYGFCYKDGYIAFQTADTFKEGNAVIAAKDADGNILWSWHIWLTDQPQGQTYYNNAGTMMDRNLGATSATPGDVGALGLLYQWGRKDPFLGSSSISSSTVAKSTISWPYAVSSNRSNGTIAYATANPTTFITDNRYNHDWYYTGSVSTDNTRWTTSKSSKSIYDPCPSGWRVPDGGNNGVWSTALGSSSSFTCNYEDSFKGINFSGMFADQTIWYPASGYRYLEDGSLDKVGNYGHYWSASPASPNIRSAHLLVISNNGSVYPSDKVARAYGHSVRCLQE